MHKYTMTKNHTLIAQANLIDEFGRTGAQFINQIHYWLQKKNVGISHDDKKWVYNTAEEWGEQLRVSSRTIRNYIRLFLNKNVIQVDKLSKHKSNRTNYITLNYKKLEGLNPQKKRENNSQPLGKKCPMVIQENTYKDLNNKSDKIVYKALKVKQAEQVIHKNIKNNGVGGTEEILGISKTNSQTAVKNTTVQDMLVLWNQTFPSSSTFMNKDLAPLLLSAFKQKCDGQMKRWQNYLQRLQSSEYITSQEFNLTLNWALKFKTMDRIFNGELGAKDIPVQLDPKTEQSRALDHIQSSTNTEEESCRNIRSLILKKLGANTYNAWFTKVKFVEVSGEIKMKAESKFVEDYILQHFGSVFSV